MLMILYFNESNEQNIIESSGNRNIVPTKKKKKPPQPHANNGRHSDPRRGITLFRSAYIYSNNNKL